MHIGLFGGTFNPIHCCHLQIAEQVQSACKLDRILFIPTGDPPHKDVTSLAPAHHRFSMVQKAIETNPSFSISEIEAQSSSVSYTVDTVSTLQVESPDVTQWSFIIGLDAFLEIDTWKNIHHLLDLCHFIVCSRPGSDFSNIASVTCIPSIPLPSIQNLANEITHRLDVPLSTSKNLTLLALPPCEASASSIRRQIQHGHTSLPWLLPDIESYILHHHLYQNGLI